MNRYKINRIGLLNYWLYDEEEFYFYDGKLLLRGTNGSGKSVTMVSFFPLLFDGNKNPERFDTFGSRDRKIEDYVLPNDFDGNENTSYLYMEFYNKEIDKYLTIGIGLRAIKNKHVDFYGFAITDNRRIKQDFMLYKNSLQKVPLTKRELQIEIGTGGEFVTSAKEYKSMVNRLLFGFENESLYTELINLMLQLRSPKLSKDYKPTKLVEILSSVLEPISDRDIETMSESIENMNKYKEKIADLKEENKAVQSLIKDFYDYSNVILYNKCEAYLKMQKELNEEKNEKDVIIKEVDTTKINIRDLENRQEEIKLILNEIAYKIANMNAKDLDNLLTEKLELHKILDELQKRWENKNTAISKKQEKELELKSNIEKTNDDIYNILKEKDDIVKTITDVAEYLYYDEVLFYLDEIKNDYQNFNFEILLKDLEKEKNELKELLSLIIKIENLNLKKDLEEEKVLKNNEQIKNINHEKRIITDKLLEEIEKLKTKIQSYINNEVLQFTNSELLEVSKVIEDSSDDIAPKIEKIFLDKYKDSLNSVNKELNNLDFLIQTEEQKIIDLNKQKDNLSNIFFENFSESETKEYLKNKNIKAKYLYEVLRFKNSVPENTQKIVEKALKAMGLFQVFLINDDDIAKDLDFKTFTATSEEKDSLVDYFEITDKNYEKMARSILKSISKSNGKISIDMTGSYKMGLIKGQVNNDYDLKYIGEDIRKRYLDVKAEEYEEKIQECKDILNNLNIKRISAINSLNILEKEYSNGLNFNDYNIHLDNLKKWDLKLEILQEDNVSKEEFINNIRKELKVVQEELDFTKKYYKGPQTSKGINEVIANFQDFQNTILELKNNANSYASKLDLMNTFKISLEEIAINIADLNLELNEILFEQKDITNKIKQLEELLNSDKYKNLKEELESLKIKEETLISEKENNLIAITNNKKDLEIMGEKQEVLTRSIQDKSLILEVLENIFKQELNLGYSSYNEECLDVLKWFKNFKLDKIITVNASYEHLMDAISKYMPKLQNYAGRKINILMPPEDLERDNFSDDNLTTLINNLYDNAKRSDLEFRYSGKTLNLIDLNKALEQELEQTMVLLNDEDRKLFEDLLMNNIGESIRKKIASSNEWIKEVKNLMESMNTSSGLSFSIKWKGKEKYTEDELDTNEIVKILLREPGSLKEEDLQKVTNHFRSKITLEEEKYEESERNYLEIIRNVLDYRKWFQFTLEFRRANMPKKELTDKEFSKFSGGEKAIAMYVPLFSGIYAKFNAARSDAPRIIALDEAFAGVDDDNILDCFRILNDMELDYVMTSQILWGDYQTIKHLAISELHHLAGSDVVSILKYKWDGIKRSLITHEREYQDES